MNDYKNFKEFYDIKLVPDLQELDKERKQVDRKVIIIGIIAVIIIIIIGRFRGNGTTYFQILAGIVAFIVISAVSKNYRQNFKSKIISKIAGFVDESLVYTPEGMVPKEEFVNSAIFRKHCNEFRGEDHFHGKMGKTAIEFSEIVAKNVTTTGTGSKRKEHRKTLFKGIFFVADFNKHFKTHTIVLPDTAEKMLGKFGQNLQAMSGSRGELIRLEDPEFEKEFCVYADDQVEARYILSSSLMKRIVDFKRKWDTKVYLSFRDSKIYIAIKMNKNLFETRLFKSIVDYNFIEENIQFLILITDIVNDLNLNTRIWTKE